MRSLSNLADAATVVMRGNSMMMMMERTKMKLKKNVYARITVVTGYDDDGDDEPNRDDANHGRIHGGHCFDVAHTGQGRWRT